ncbi:hypothetical protein C9I49_00855 [Pseudomonas prosekii]|uniref:Uncharacterized protein n=1 Tax=Pseudomonas prosekii TaxID=1148509 RepID=A0A2U2DEZ2_9PSED|nr:hypothetical protein C9I49_00855 [Pseudomonas prosekii]
MASGTRGDLDQQAIKAGSYIPCGSELARDDGVSVNIYCTGTPLSRASSLPQGIAYWSGSLADDRFKRQLARFQRSGRIRGLITCGIQQ